MVTSGSRGWGEYYSTTGPKFLRVGNLNRGGIELDLSDVAHVRPPVGAEGERTRVRVDDILVSITADVGMVGLVEQDVGEAYVNQHVAVARPRPGLVPRFLAYALIDPEGLQKEVGRVQYGMTKASLSLEQVRELPVQVPPLPEQHRIVAKLDELRARSRKAREALDEVPALLDKLKQSVLAAAFRGDLTAEWRAAHPDVEPATVLLERIRVERRKRWEEANPKKKYVEPEPVDTEGLPDLPQGWCWASVEELSSLVTDGDHNPPKRVATGVPHLTARNIKGWHVNLDGCSYISADGFEQTRSRYEPLAGDLIVTCVGTLGQTAIVPPGLVFSADRNLAAIRVIPNGIENRVLLLALNTTRAQVHMGAVSGSSAQPHIYLSDLRAVRVPLAPAREQRALAASVDATLSVVDRMQAQMPAMRGDLTSLDQSLLARAFRGELVPQDPNDEPADVLLARIKAASADTQTRAGKREARQKATP